MGCDSQKDMDRKSVVLPLSTDLLSDYSSNKVAI